MTGAIRQTSPRRVAIHPDQIERSSSPHRLHQRQPNAFETQETIISRHMPFGERDSCQRQSPVRRFRRRKSVCIGPLLDETRFSKAMTGSKSMSNFGSKQSSYSENEEKNVNEKRSGNWSENFEFRLKSQTNGRNDCQTFQGSGRVCRRVKGSSDWNAYRVA
jgi:hypothetical protein